MTILLLPQKNRLVFSGSLFTQTEDLWLDLTVLSKKTLFFFLYKGKKEKVVDQTGTKIKILRFGLLMGCKTGTR